MTSMAVLYLSDSGQPLGAASTTVPGDLPPLDQASRLRVGVPVPVSLAAPPPAPLVPHPITVEGNELALAQLEAEFDDPLEVFQWRVVETRGPGTTVDRRLDRLGAGRVILTGTTSGPELLLDVPRLGSELRLDYEVRSQAGLHLKTHLDFGATDARKTTPVLVPDMGDWVVLVRGYGPAAPVRLRIIRGNVGGKGRQLTLKVPRREDELELNYRVVEASGPVKTGKALFAGTAPETQATVQVTKNEQVNVFVDGYPPVAVPPVP